jgi:hypothetical protein
VSFLAAASNEEIAGRVIFDVLLVALAVWLLVSANRRERQGVRSTGRYIGGVVLLVAFVAAVGSR